MMHLKHLKRKQIALLISGLTMNTVFSVAMAADASDTKSADDANVTSLTDVTVKSERQIDTVSRAKQEVAPNLINVTSAEEIRKLPDVNAGEAVRRLPGISLEADTGEGRFVNIRGLDADLTSTTFGGVRLPPTNIASPFGGGRAVAFDTIPVGMIGSITATKTNKPEQDAEALGGTIEITPKAMPPSGQPFFEGRLGGGSELLHHSGLSDVSITGGIRFGGSGNSDSGLTSYTDKPFSFVGTYSRYEDRRGVDDLEGGYAADGNSSLDPKAYSTLDQRYYNYHRTRQGGGGELTFQPDAANKWHVSYYDFGYTEFVNRQNTIFNFSGTVPRNPDGSFTESGVSIDKATSAGEETIRSKVFTIGGENNINSAKVDYHIAHTDGSDYRPWAFSSTFTNPTTATVNYNNVANPNYPAYTVSGLNPFNPSGYTMSKFSTSSGLARTTEWSGATNVAMPTHWTSADSEEFKTGVSARLRTNNNVSTPESFSAVPGVPLSQVITGSSINSYYDGHYQNGSIISSDALQNLFAQGSGFVENTAADALHAAAQQTHNTENVYAVYGQQQMTFGKLSLLGGARVETTSAQYQGNAIIGSTVTPVETTNKYTNLFPSLQARYELAPNSIARASFSSTIARPGFNQTSAATNVDLIGNVVSTGNPNLRPTLSNNFDLSFEHYLPHAGIVSLGVFDKELKDYIVNKLSFQTFANSGIYAGLSPNTQLVSYTNISSARARGLEANYEQRFTFLPGILNGLGAGFNWTYVASSLEIRPGENSALPSTSRNTYNGTVFWERNGLNLRLGAYYVGRNLFGIGADSTQDIYSEARLSADFGASYQVTKNYGLFLSVKNLLNTPLKFTEGTSDRVIQRETYGQTVEVGANFSF